MKMKSLLREAPDIVYIEDGTLSYDDSDAWAFGYTYIYTGKGKFKIENKVTHGEIGLGNGEYLGRLWTDSNVISFWEYPETKKIKKEVLSDIEGGLGQYGVNINFDSGWRLEIPNPDGEDVPNNKPWKYMNAPMYDPDVDELIPLEDFDGAKNLSDLTKKLRKKQRQQHVKSPGMKATGKEKYDYGKAIGKKDVEKQRKKQKQRTRKLGYSGDYEPSMKIKRFREVIREIIKANLENM